MSQTKEDVIDFYFPKGRDERRGDALVVLAISYIEGIKQGIKEALSHNDSCRFWQSQGCDCTCKEDSNMNERRLKNGTKHENEGLRRRRNQRSKNR